MSDTPEESAEEPLPKVAELKPLVLPSVNADMAKRAQENFKKVFRSQSIEREEDYEHLKGLQQHYRHKGCWSYFLMAVMASMILFQSVLLGMVGAGYWDFSTYKWLLPLLLVQNLAQIIGLAVWVVKALFKDLK